MKIFRYNYSATYIQMTAVPKDIRQRKTEIQLLVGSDHIPKAIKRLMDFSTDFSTGREHLSAIIQINGELSKLEQELQDNNIEQDKFEHKRTELAREMLELTDQIETQHINEKK